MTARRPARRPRPAPVPSASVPSALALSACLVATFAATPAFAHEYWLDPFDATPEPGGLLVANVKNGQDFAGSGFPYDPNRMSRLDLVGPEGSSPIPARLGDFPAVQVAVGDAGHYLVVLDTFARPLVYDTLEDFATFVDYHGQHGVLEAHAARGLAETDIRETYFRHVKTLARAGAPADPDAPGTPSGEESPTTPPFAVQDQALELVPLNDPYADDELGLRLLERGEIVADAQVELFVRTLDDELTRVVERTDAAGEVRFDVAEAGDYLANAVRVNDPADDPADVGDTAPQWVSHWASLTFEKRGVAR